MSKSVLIVLMASIARSWTLRFSLGSGEWFLWEFPLAFWLESQGYDVTYISNLDTHADPRGLRRAKGFLSVGHDEYYTIEMFNNSAPPSPTD